MSHTGTFPGQYITGVYYPKYPFSRNYSNAKYHDVYSVSASNPRATSKRQRGTGRRKGLLLGQMVYKNPPKNKPSFMNLYGTM